MSPGLASSWTTLRPWLETSALHVRLSQYCGHSCGFKERQDTEVPLQRPLADFHRLARRIFGKSIGLVLGGGGARGFSHLGVIKALEERGIPVDIVGGTSIGAFVAGNYASHLSWKLTFDAVRHFATELSTKRFQFLADLTYPWLSITTGRKFNALIKCIFGAMHLEDSWLDFYACVTNLSRFATHQILDTGTAWDAVRASMSLLGPLPPLWRDGELLLDGCYSANVPVSGALALKADTIFAVDVGASKDLTSLKPWGTELSQWPMLLKRFFHTAEDPPTQTWITEILMQAMSKNDVEATKNMPNMHYTYMPVGDYQGQDFGSFYEIFDIGYKHAVAWLDDLEKSGKLDGICLPKKRA
jgi:lysophospholipid hydrolase